jgi:SAM-dependent methyltransferase
MKEYYGYILQQNKVNEVFLASYILTKKTFYNKKINVLDVGGLPAIDASYAAEKGDTVTVLDIYKDGSIYIKNKNIDFINKSIVDFTPDINKYELVNMQFLLSLIGKKEIKNIFNKVRNSLKEGGVFSFTVHDKKDSLFKNRGKNIFLNKEEIFILLKNDFKEVDIVEKKYYENDIQNNMHSWHYYEVICRK